MNIERIKNDKGEFRCFEINNRIISRNGMAQVVSMLEGANVNHSPKFYDDEVFCKFEFKGHEFEMTEPYGDSSVYDVVGPEGAQEEIEIIAKHFEASLPIKGGDSGHNAFFLVNWLIGSFIFLGVIYGIFQGIKWVIS